MASEGAGRSILVVGGGVVGAFCALELALRGADVTLVERQQPGVGATGASAGMLAPSFEAADHPALHRIGLLSRSLWTEWAARIEEASQWPVALRRDGMFVVGCDAGQTARLRRMAEALAAAGSEARRLDAAQARRIHPGLAADVEEVVFLPAEAQVDAQRLATALADALSNGGVRLVRGETVEAFVFDATGVKARIGRRTLGPFDAVVLAAGAWSGLPAGLPREVPVRPVRGQIVRLLPPRPVPAALVADLAGHYLVPRANGTLLAGSTMEDVGFDDRTTEEARDELARAAVRLLPDLAGATIAEHWAGLRPLTPDRLPILGPDPDEPRLLYACGHGRNGILLAPLTAIWTADWLLRGCAPSPEAEALGIGRFERAPKAAAR